MPSILSSHFSNDKGGGFLVKEFSADMGNTTLPNDGPSGELAKTSKNKLGINSERLLGELFGQSRLA